MKTPLFLILAALVAAPACAADSTVVATVDGQNITRGEVDATIKELPPQIQQLPKAAIYPQVLEQMIVERVIKKAGMDAGLDGDAVVLQRMADAKGKIVADEFLRREVKKKLTDSKLRAEYDVYVKNFKPTEEVRASHILVKDEAEAKAILDQLAKGGDFTKIATEKSIDKGAAAKGGDLGYFGRGQMVEEFEKAAFAMKKGDVSKTPVKTDFGYHIIKLVDKRNTKPDSFETMKPQLETVATQEAAKDVVKALVQKASIQRFDADGKTMVSPAAAKPTETKKP